MLAGLFGNGTVKQKKKNWQAKKPFQAPETPLGIIHRENEISKSCGSLPHENERIHA